MSKKNTSTNEIGKYAELKEKLAKACEEYGYTYSIQNKGYPFLLIIKPMGGMDAQQMMMEGLDAPGDTGYINPDASLVFAYRDGDLSYKISETFTISEKRLNKLKGLFQKLHAMWMQYFYRDVYEHYPAFAAENRYSGPQQASDPADGENTDDAFADFMMESEPAVEDDCIEDTEDEE